jgi:hypothetical protein
MFLRDWTALTNFSIDRYFKKDKSCFFSMSQITASIDLFIRVCLFIDPGMERDHVLSTWSRRTTHWTLNRTLISRSSVLTSSRKSYLFHSLNLGACSSLIEWNRIDIVEKWIDIDQWSTHRSEDDKTICEERTLIDDLFFWISSIIFIRDEIRDHLSGFSLYLTQIFTFISLPSLPAAWIRAWLTISSFESQSIILTIFAASSPRANWIQTIYSFEPRFNQIRAAPQPEQPPIPASHQTLAKSLRSQSNPRSPQATKLLQPRISPRIPSR